MLGSIVFAGFRAADLGASSRKLWRSEVLRMMKRFLLALPVGAAFLLLPLAAHADKYAGEFLRLGAGARPLGMGGAFVALADDASAVYWNPAGLAGSTDRELLLMHAEQFGSLINYDFGAFSIPVSTGAHPSAVGLGVVRLAVDNIPDTRNAFLDFGLDGVDGTGDQGEGNGVYDLGEPIDPSRFTYDSDVEMAFLVSYARSLSDKLSVGGTLKLLRQELLTNSSFGIGADLAALYSPRPDFSVGVRLADITTTQISWDTGTRETISPTTLVGAQYTREIAALRGSVTAGVDVNLGFDGADTASQFSSGAVGGDLAAGLEYWFQRTLALRVGSTAGNMTAGAGLRVSRFGVDYAFVSHDEFDDSHRISASVTF
jgi:hypothetical protein